MKLTAAENRLEACFESIRARLPFSPEIAVVLGSGLGGLAQSVEQTGVIAYEDISGFPVSTVSGHAGRFVFCRIGSVPAVLMDGRVHFYEGYSMEDVVLPVRLMRRMGAKILILSNAAGGLNTEFSAGDLMLITDQISSFVPSPLAGPNPETLGTRFPDMTEIYDRALGNILKEQAEALGFSLREGVYIQMSGPNYESPAEVRMCRMLGADAVGMSTACEAVAARHCGFRICGISCITNLASGLSEKALSHEEVKAAADEAGPRFRSLIMNAIPHMVN